MSHQLILLHSYNIYAPVFDELRLFLVNEGLIEWDPQTQAPRPALSARRATCEHQLLVRDLDAGQVSAEVGNMSEMTYSLMQSARAPGTLRWQGAPPSPCRLRAGTAAFESVFAPIFSALRSPLGRPPGTRTFVDVPRFSRSTAAGYPTWAASVVLRLWVWGKPTPRPHSVR